MLYTVCKYISSVVNIDFWHRTNRRETCLTLIFQSYSTVFPVPCILISVHCIYTCKIDESVRKGAEKVFFDTEYWNPYFNLILIPSHEQY